MIAGKSNWVKQREKVDGPKSRLDVKAVTNHAYKSM